MDMRCEYEAVNTNISYIQVSTSLQLDGKGGHPNVKCWCQASLQLWAVSKYNRTLASDQCSIVITRCPVYMSIWGSCLIQNRDTVAHKDRGMLYMLALNLL